jgi:hypothetical protein
MTSELVPIESLKAETALLQTREHYADRNASLPDGTGFSAPYTGDAGYYTEIVRGEIPAGLLRLTRVNFKRKIELE